MIIGFTGHQRIDHSERWGWVRDQFLRVLREHASAEDRVRSSLAEGGDQLFFEAAFVLGLAADIVLPCEHYAMSFAGPTEKARYRELLAKAASVETLAFVETCEEAFLAAGKYVVDHADLVVTLWNGKPAAGKGGTGDIVEYARSLERPIIHVNPDVLRVSGPS